MRLAAQGARAGACGAERQRRRAWTVAPFALILLLLVSASGRAQGQGLRIDKRDASALKADGSSTRALALSYAQAANGLKAAALLAATAPSNNVKCATGSGGGGSLCAASPQLKAAPDAVLNMTAAPAEFDARNPAHTGGVSAAVLEAHDQGRCGACVAFAVAAAAEAAVAMALRRDAAPLSTSDLYFCAGAGAYRRCQDGWRLEDALQELASRSQAVRPYSCLPWPQLADIQLLDPAKACAAKCDAAPLPGSFRTTVRAPFSDLAAVQAWIRKAGAVVSRINIPPDFAEFFRSNPAGVYRNFKAPLELGAPGVEPHAVAIVGYNNADNYFIIKQSWGPNFADKGFARVGYGSLGLADLEYTYGVEFVPSDPKARPPLPLAFDGALPQGCAWYQAQPGDFLHRVADAVDMPLISLIERNAAVVGKLPTLGAWLPTGTRLVVCSDTVVRRFNPALLAAKGREQAALLAMKAAIDPAGAVLGATWKSGSDPCTNYWVGVTCDAKGERVVRIDLWQQKLTGDISRVDLAPLAGLEALNLAGTPLRGTVPAGWAAAASLKHLDLNGCAGVGGTLPAAWAALRALDTLTLARCALVGTLPPEWGRLAGLRRLDLSDNPGLAGTLPPEWARMQGLKLLGLARGRFTGSLPEAWGGLPGLEVLWLGENRLGGTLPSWAGKGMARLQYLTVDRNDISGSIPLSWATQLPRVASFSVDGNPNLAGCLPPSWSTNTIALSPDLIKDWSEDPLRKRFQGTRVCGYCGSPECARPAAGGSARRRRR